ncbi:centromere/kinetochore protein zw10 homolog [Euwallacea similis]|uniref:centromere/kinetochore protein zw10 homolog n=1 Tax=Euwallacea similis TaxID=1736056 RepID=UPI00344CF7F8
MSFVAQIVQSATENWASTLSKNTPELERTVEDLMKDVTTYVENVYVKYVQRNTTNSALLNKAILHQTKLKELQEKAQCIKDKDLDLDDVSKNIVKLQIIDAKLHYLLNIRKVLQLFNDLDSSLASSAYLKGAHIVLQLRETVTCLLPEKSQVFDILEEALQDKETVFFEALNAAFKNNVKLIKKDGKSSLILKIKKHNQQMQEVISGLYQTMEQVTPLFNMAIDLWLNIFTPLVNHEFIVSTKEDNTYASLELTKKSEQKASYKVVFDNLHTVLKFLKQNFSYNVIEEELALQYIGNDIRDNLSELIIKQCLRDTIPSDEEALKGFKVVQQATEGLEKSLLEAHVFTKDTVSILQYVNNIDVLFINKKCEEYLNVAMEIIKKDLHDIVELDMPTELDSPLGDHEELTQCSVSKNVVELLKFCEKILQTAVESSPTTGGKLFDTVTKILCSYRTFVPGHYKTYLTTLPQQIAIFLNNCQYVRYRLIQWELEYSNQLKDDLQYCDFTTEIRAFPVVGMSLFHKYLDTQLKQIEEIMVGAQLGGPTIEKLEPNTEKCVRQCLRQQELLRTVWHKVLQYKTYNQNMGTIVNTLCESIINPILKCQDISATAAGELVDIIKLVLARGAKLFTNPNEVTLYVSLWNKLNELNFVLNASLVDIQDRWANRKGPLALYFTVPELKQLIMALFQNTDRRAQVLSRIS